MRLFYSPSACSIIPHIVLEEIGRPFDAQHVLRGETQSDAYLRINPKGKVPLLVLDHGVVVTENPVILQLLARMYPECELLPPNHDNEYEALQICEYLIGTIQVYGLTKLFRPSLFCEEEQHWDGIRKQGEQMLLKGFDLIAPRLGRGPFLFERFSIADACMFYFELHASRLRIAMPGAVRAHFDIMMARQSVQKVILREGLDLADFLPASHAL